MSLLSSQLLRENYASSSPSEDETTPKTFAAYVYFPILLPFHLEQCLQNLSENLNADEPYAIIQPQFWHVSLSRPFSVEFKDIEPLVRTLNQQLGGCRAVRLGTKGVFQLANEDESSHFACVALEETSREDHQSVDLLIENIDRIVQQFGCPRFHVPRRLHFSIARCDSEFAAFLLPVELRGHVFYLDEVECRIGSKKYLIHL